MKNFKITCNDIMDGNFIVCVVINVRKVNVTPPKDTNMLDMIFFSFFPPSSIIKSPLKLVYLPFNH